MTDARHDREGKARGELRQDAFPDRPLEGRIDAQVDAATQSMLEQVRAGYGPAPLDPVRRASLQRSLARRLEGRGSRWRMGAPLLAVAVAAGAAALVWLRLPVAVPAAVPQATAPPIVAQPIAADDTQAADAWVAEVFDPPELGKSRTVQDRSLYPADLAAIDVAFLGN